jgi:N-acetylneuraminic acid mutarotase
MTSIRYIFGIILCFCSSVSIAQWTQEKNYPGGQTDAVIAFTIGDTVYIGGGSGGSKAFYKYDPATGQWTKKGNIPARAFGVSFSIGSKGYVALGQLDPANTGQSSVTNTLYEYDPTMDTWTKKASFPGTARDAAFAFVIGNIAYVGGGTDAQYRVYSDFYSYDPTADSWTELGALPNYLYFNSTFVIGNYGYVATGVADTNEISSMWQYDPSSDSWNPMSDFPGMPRESAVAFALNGKGYVGLGQTQYTSVFSDFYSYDPTANQWTSVTSFPASYGRGWAAGVSTSSRAFVGLGTYFLNSNLIGNTDFWEFSLPSSVSSAVSECPSAIFPNPATDFVSIQIPNSELEATIIVRNEIGAVCLTTHINSSQTLNVSSLPAGIYNIEITAGEYHSVQRIVKE